MNSSSAPKEDLLQPKRRRGRPRKKVVPSDPELQTYHQPKQRGRPRKRPLTDISNLTSKPPANLHSPSRSRSKRTKTSNLGCIVSKEETCDVDTTWVDASHFNEAQLMWIKSKFHELLHYLDFVHCDDDMLLRLFPCKYKNDPPSCIPVTKKRNVSTLQEFVRLGPIQQRTLIEKSHGYIHKTQMAEKSCLELSLHFLIDGCKQNLVSKYRNGFEALVRQAIRSKADLITPNNNITSEVVDADGIIEQNETKKGKRIRFYLGHYSVSLPIVHRFKFRAASCNGKLQDDGTLICSECQSELANLRRLCYNACRLRENELHSKTRNSYLLHSPLLVEKKFKIQGNELHQMQKRESKRKIRALIKKMNAKERTIDTSISTGIGAAIMDNRMKEAAKGFWDSKEEMTQSELAKGLFDESIKNAEVAKKLGKRHVRYPPIIIRFANMLLRKLSIPVYNFLAETYHLPTSRTLGNFDSLDSSSPDGLMYESVDQMERELKELNTTIANQDEQSDKKYPPAEWSNKGTLSFDAMHVKDKVAFNPHSMDIVAVVNEGFNEDVLLTEFEALHKEARESDDDGGDGEGAENKASSAPTVAKQFLIFMYQNWSSDMKPMKYMVARYAVGSGIAAVDLVRKLDTIISALHMHNITVVNVTSDGASENRSAMNLLATKKAKDVFADLPEDFPNKNVAFEHPCNSSIDIFIGGEMPHWVKKFVNAMELTSSEKSARDLQCEGKHVSLRMVEDLWIKDRHSPSDHRTNKFTEEHFHKNAFSRMRCHLAMQVTSNSTCELIDEYGTDDHSFLKTIISKIDRMIDIWNGAAKKGCNWIDSPDHPHLQELMDILRVFVDWKKSIPEKNPEHFIPWQLFNDLSWIVYGIVGLARRYLCKDKSRTMIQRRGGSDVCEHEFARIRLGNPNPDIAAAKGASSKNAGFRATAFQKCAKCNSGATETAYRMDELNQPVHKLKHTTKRRRQRDKVKGDAKQQKQVGKK